ncbi:RNA-guided endonuclease InsQ/TnpB family protein [Deinococcus hopiensis]|uniref:RNA-guided endonuclease InsQ/TnpB family protein n=1 Tax=Deinococcus hopiensis TaxID=309885 RepID=UPI001FECF860|nr:transposase [Deinococcus hopiensis]
MFYKKDYSFKKGQQVSVDTLDKRIVIPHEGYAKHLEYIQNGAEIGSGTLWYDKRKKQYSLLVALTITVPDPQPTDHKRVIGVDVGQRYHAVATDTRSNAAFFSGKAARQKKDHFARLRKKLQRQGIRSATRRLIALSGRERRFIAAHNHKLANDILARFPQALIGLEDLRKICERTEGRRNKDASKKSRKNKRRRSQWSFAELQAFIDDKAPLAIKVDANYTSQACTSCGHTSKANRPNAGLMFRCESCGYEVHSDLLGGRNIALRTLVVRQDWAATGCLSTTPDVSCSEVKAARLSRYAELRWSTDTNPSL